MPTAWAPMPIRPPSRVRERDPHAVAGLAEALGGRVLEREVGRGARVEPHLLLLAGHAEALGAGADEEGGRAVVLLGEDEEDAREGAVGDPLLGAGDAVVADARAHRAGVTARAGFGQRERGELLARGERRDDLFDLLVGAVVEDRQRARRSCGRRRSRRRRRRRERAPRARARRRGSRRRRRRAPRARTRPSARARRARRRSPSGTCDRDPRRRRCGAIFSSANRFASSRISCWSSVSSCGLTRTARRDP